MKKKKYPIIYYLIICIASGLSGCSKPSVKPPVEFKEYSSKKENFSIQLPKDWNVRENFESAVFAAASPSEKFFGNSLIAITVQVSDLSREATLDEYYQEHIEVLKKNNIPFVEKGLIAIADTNAKCLIVTYGGAKNITYFLMNGSKAKKVYWIIFRIEDQSRLGEFSKSFRKILQSFKFNS